MSSSSANGWWWWCKRIWRFLLLNVLFKRVLREKSHMGFLQACVPRKKIKKGRRVSPRAAAEKKKKKNSKEEDGLLHHTKNEQRTHKPHILGDTFWTHTHNNKKESALLLLLTCGWVNDKENNNNDKENNEISLASSCALWEGESDQHHRYLLLLCLL